jgi:hypothetical protein
LLPVVAMMSAAAPERRDQAARLVDLLVDGLRHRA